MSERYSKLFSLPENLYAAGSPVVIAAGALLKDNQTGKVIAQIKMRSISGKRIKAAKVSVVPLDTVGNILGDAVQYQYLDLNVGRDEDFGAKAPISMPNAATRGFFVSVEEIAFIDNTVWRSNGEPWKMLPKQQPLGLVHSLELEKQFHIKFGHDYKYIPLVKHDLWFCACGALNHSKEADCHTCRRSLAVLNSIDIAELNREKDARLAAEKEQADRAAEAARIAAEQARVRAKKNGKIAAIIIPIVVVIVVAAVLISGVVKKNNAYNDALALMDAGQYEQAIEAFTVLDGYKDSAEQIQLAEAAMLEEQKAKAYAEAIALLEAGKYGEAYAAFEALGDYKNAKEFLSSFGYYLVESDGVQYKYDTYGNLVEEDHGNWDYYYQYTDNLLVCEGNLGSDWAKTEYTYYPDGTLKSRTAGISRASNGNVMWQTVYYNEAGYPETAVHERDSNPYENTTWNLSYTLSDSGSITALTCSVQNYGEAEAVMESFDFSDHNGFVSIEIVENYSTPVRLTFTNVDRTYAEYYFLNYSSYFKSFSMRKDWERTTEYDESGKIASETTVYPGSGLKTTKDYSYDNQGNLIKDRSKDSAGNSHETTYTYGYIYCPDAT